MFSRECLMPDLFNAKSEERQKTRNPSGGIPQLPPLAQRPHEKNLLEIKHACGYTHIQKTLK